ncbi:hypothetical protein OIV83_003375 [Microbotryomycetes sp. JL201]|nr:hypothetical protein OIV83_003375 [Microbotryomycetes sp. JL201]
MSTASSTTTTPSKRPNRRFSQLKQAYKAAAAAFLVRDYASAGSHLHEAKQACPDTPIGFNTTWVKTIANGGDNVAHDLHRKVVILETTYLATVLSGPNKTASDAVPADVAKWLKLTPSQLLPTLWLSWIGESKSEPTIGDILPSVSAAYLHPSLIVAITLGALKLNEPKAARAIIDAWSGSVAEDLERLVWEESNSVDWQTDFVVEQDGDSMTASGMMGTAGSSRRDKPTAKRSLLASYIKAVDLQALHVLPGLGEWEAAEDFVRLQSVENGGWLPDARISALLTAIKRLQEQQAHLEASRVERIKQLETNRLASSMTSAASSDKEKRKSHKGKGKAHPGAELPPSGKTSASHSSSSSSEASSPKSSPLKRNAATKVGTSTTAAHSASRSSPATTGLSGFAALRESLVQYLGSPSMSQSRTSQAPNSLLPRFPLRSLIQDDPLRLLSIICVLFAFTSWIRRRRRMGIKALPSVSNAAGGVRSGVILLGSKLIEFVRMGTKVTQL